MMRLSEVFPGAGSNNLAAPPKFCEVLPRLRTRRGLRQKHGAIFVREPFFSPETHLNEV